MANDWQTTKSTLKDRAGQLLISGDLSDCEFCVGNEEIIIKSHKIFLAISSPVFYAMFYGDMAEKSPVVIKDIEPKAFSGMLEYIYTDSVEFKSCNHACEIFSAATKYLLPFLEEQCINYLQTHIDGESACELYEFAKFHNLKNIEETCLQKFQDETDEVLKSAGFLEADISTVTTILEQEKMQISTELEVFNAVQAWTKAESERRGSSAEAHSVLVNDVINKIRFLTLTAEEFTGGPALSNLLTAEEKLAVAMNITKPGVIALPTRINSGIGPRRVVVEEPFEEEWRLVRQCSDYIAYPVTKWVNPFPKKGLVVSRNIKLVGLRISSQKKDDSSCLTYNENVTVVLKKDWALKFSGAKLQTEVEYNSTFEVMFYKPIVLEANKKYWIIVQFDKSGEYIFSRDVNNVYESHSLKIELTPEFSTITEFVFNEKL